MLALKAALLVRLRMPAGSDELVWVLRLCTAPKLDLDCLPADFILRHVLLLLGELAHHVLDMPWMPSSAHHHLDVAVLTPAGSEQLCSAKFVLVCEDAYCLPLHSPYHGTFRILERHPRTFILDVYSNRLSVSIDKLKAAYVTDYYFEDVDVCVTAAHDDNSVPSHHVSDSSHDVHDDVCITKASRISHLPVHL